MLGNSYKKRHYLTIKNGKKIHIEILQNVHFAKITIEIFHWYNVHYQFISNGYIVLLLVVNCKSNIIINRNQCNYITYLLYSDM